MSSFMLWLVIWWCSWFMAALLADIKRAKLADLQTLSLLFIMAGLIPFAMGWFLVKKALKKDI